MSTGLLARLLGVGYMLHVPPDARFAEPSWLANIEAVHAGLKKQAEDPAKAEAAYGDYLTMLEHWFAPMAERYMEALDERDAEVSQRMLAVLTAHYGVLEVDHPHPALRAARHAAKRILGGQQ